MENMKEEAKTEAASYINETIEEAKLTATKEAKRIIVTSIQRVATETAIENAVTVFNIDSDEVKGRIIGREGRNIRALEAATGIEIIVDDTPEAIILSGFDPVRREIARLALHQLVTDGRIHPARIEEVVAKVKKQIEANLQNQQRDLENKLKENDRLKEQMNSQLQSLNSKKEELASVIKEQNARLEQISGMSAEDAKNI